ncbi:MAG: carbohydrate ABC transporter permease [Anaerolineaceae bacterium]|nr:MAG: carbohydrate ABC transporter permease [Anaerolineaceae bacterium]
MVTYKTVGGRIFKVINAIFLGSLAMISLVPIINILAISFSSGQAAAAGKVFLWPINFNLNAYKFVMSNPIFWNSFWVSIKRVIIGVPVNLILIILTAYPLSLTNKELKGRSFFSWFFMFSMLFSGGLIPLYLTIQMTGLIDSFWSLVVPSAVPVYYVIIMINFFRQVPKEIVEASEIDGAGYFGILFKIMVPLVKPAIATIILLCFILHWNSWFDGLLYIGQQNKQPLQSYLQALLARPIDVGALARNPEQWKVMQFVNERTVKSAQIFIATIPIMIIYPIAQNYFIKGGMLGAVKG